MLKLTTRAKIILALLSLILALLPSLPLVKPESPDRMEDKWRYFHEILVGTQKNKELAFFA